MDLKSSDIEEWYKIKQEISRLEKLCEKFKSKAKYTMNSHNVKSLKGNGYKVDKRSISKEVIRKKDLPIDIWNKYKSISSFDSFYINPVTIKKSENKLVSEIKQKKEIKI